MIAMIKILTLPNCARYDYTDKFGSRHYHSDNRHYVVDGLGRVKSYINSEYDLIFCNPNSNYE